MIMCHGRLGGFGFDVISSWVTTGTSTATNMLRWWTRWVKGAHVHGHVHQWTNERSMQSRRTNEACEVDERDELAPSQTSEPVKPSNMKARNNMLRLHQANQGTSKTPCTSPCRGEAVIHYEEAHQPVTLKLNLHFSNCTNVPTLPCRAMSWVMSPTSLLWAMLSINVR